MPDREKSGRRGRIGRPRSEAADAHEAIMDAVYALLQERSMRDLTMDTVAKRAGVGKPTLYKWWPSKAALVFAMFHERLSRKPAHLHSATVEESLRFAVRLTVGELGDIFGKVMAELIAEGQSEPAILRELYNRHIAMRRAYTIAEIERGKARGEFAAATNPELLVDALIGPLYYRMLLRITPLDEAYADKLLDQVLSGVRSPPRQ